MVRRKGGTGRETPQYDNRELEKKAGPPEDSPMIKQMLLRATTGLYCTPWRVSREADPPLYPFPHEEQVGRIYGGEAAIQSLPCLRIA